MTAGSGFALTKWYLDCVDAEGRAAVAYWSQLTWRKLKATWHSMTSYEPGELPRQRSSVVPVAAPSRSDTTIDWHSGALACRITGHPHVPAIEMRLLGRKEGSVDWCCEAASGDMSVEHDDALPLHGRGYVERLTLTLPPWQLPIEELRWGRWISWTSGRSLVWIDWRGDSPLTAVFKDGRPEVSAVVGDDKIEAGTHVLNLTSPTVLHSQSLATTLGCLLPIVAPILPKTWLAVEDCKWRSVGTLDSDGATPDRGWVIHEKVMFPS